MGQKEYIYVFNQKELEVILACLMMVEKRLEKKKNKKEVLNVIQHIKMEMGN